MKYPKSKLCQLPRLSCFGCCGHSFGTKAQLERALKKNTKEYKEFKSKTKFRDRSELLRSCGICRNLVIQNKKIICPLHPALNGKDLRIDHCDINHLCKTCKKFNTWDIKKQKKFIKFIEQKNPSWYEYSINIDKGKYLKEFEK